MDRMEDLIRSENIELVRLETEDLNGTPRGLTLDVDYFRENLLTGIPLENVLNFTCSGYTPEDYQLHRNNESLYPDMETFVTVPWQENVASVLADFKSQSSGLPLPTSSRAICKKQLKRLEEMGYHFLSACEYEFNVVSKETKKCVSDVAVYGSPLLQNTTFKFVQDIMKNLKKIGVPPEKYHTESASSRIELVIKPSFGIKGADDAMRYKSAVKEICLEKDILALFMWKPFQTAPYGTPLHFNASLWDVHDKVNMFYHPDNAYKLSNIAMNWIAGLQEHYEALACIACPTVNCYEGLKAGKFLANNETWEIDNRDACFRVKNISPKSTYIENRICSAATNPYLLAAASIMAGIDGIVRNLQPSAPLNVNPKGSKEFPKSLQEALQYLNDDQLFCEQFGNEFIADFNALKNLEMRFAEENIERKWEWYSEYYGNLT